MFFVGGVLISVFGVYVYGSFTTREAPFTHPVVPYTAPVLVVLDILYKYHSLGAITLACFLFTSKLFMRYPSSACRRGVQSFWCSLVPRLREGRGRSKCARGGREFRGGGGGRERGRGGLSCECGSVTRGWLLVVLLSMMVLYRRLVSSLVCMNSGGGCWEGDFLGKLL